MRIIREWEILTGEVKCIQGRGREAKGRKAADDFNSTPIVTSPFLLSHIRSDPYTRMRMYCDGENTDLGIL
jgi:hypothetical protein